MMSPLRLLLHLSDIRFPYRRCHGKQNGAVNEGAIKGVNVGCSKSV